MNFFLLQNREQKNFVFSIQGHCCFKFNTNIIYNWHSLVILMMMMMMMPIIFPSFHIIHHNIRHTLYFLGYHNTIFGCRRSYLHLINSLSLSVSFESIKFFQHLNFSVFFIVNLNKQENNVSFENRLWFFFYH